MSDRAEKTQPSSIEATATADHEQYTSTLVTGSDHSTLTKANVTEDGETTTSRAHTGNASRTLDRTASGTHTLARELGVDGGPQHIVTTESASYSSTIHNHSTAGSTLSASTDEAGVVTSVATSSHSNDGTKNRTRHNIWHELQETRTSTTRARTITDRNFTLTGNGSFTNSDSTTTTIAGNSTTVAASSSGSSSSSADSNWNDKQSADGGTGDFVNGRGATPTFTSKFVPSSGSGSGSGSGTGGWVYTSPGTNGSWYVSSWSKIGSQHGDAASSYDANWTSVTAPPASGGSSGTANPMGLVTTKTGYTHQSGSSSASFSEVASTANESETHIDDPTNQRYYWSAFKNASTQTRTASDMGVFDSKTTWSASVPLESTVTTGHIDHSRSDTSSSSWTGSGFGIDHGVGTGSGSSSATSTSSASSWTDSSGMSASGSNGMDIFGSFDSWYDRGGLYNFGLGNALDNLHFDSAGHLIAYGDDYEQAVAPDYQAPINGIGKLDDGTSLLEQVPPPAAAAGTNTNAAAQAEGEPAGGGTGAPGGGMAGLNQALEQRGRSSWAPHPDNIYFLAYRWLTTPGSPLPPPPPPPPRPNHPLIDWRLEYKNWTTAILSDKESDQLAANRAAAWLDTWVRDVLWNFDPDNGIGNPFVQGMKDLPAAMFNKSPPVAAFNSVYGFYDMLANGKESETSKDHMAFWTAVYDSPDTVHAFWNSSPHEQVETVIGGGVYVTTTNPEILILPFAGGAAADAKALASAEARLDAMRKIREVGTLPRFVAVKGKGIPLPIVTPEMESKILFGQRAGTNRIIGGHSGAITNAHPNYAVEVISTNPNGTSVVKFITEFPDGTLSKIKTSTLFPPDWTDSSIISRVRQAGASEAFKSQISNHASFHRMIVNGIEIEVLKICDEVIAAYPTGR